MPKAIRVDEPFQPSRSKAHRPSARRLSLAKRPCTRAVSASDGRFGVGGVPGAHGVARKESSSPPLYCAIEASRSFLNASGLCHGQAGCRRCRRRGSSSATTIARTGARRSTVAEHRAQNIHLRGGVSEAEFVKLRTGRDATLPLPDRILFALQVNLRDGRLPPPESDGRSYFKVPANRF